VDLKIHTTLKILVSELYLMIPIGLLILCNSEENLRAALGKMRVNSRAIEDVMDKVRNRHYQVGILAAAYKFSSKWFSIFLTRCLTFVNNLLKHMQLACTLTFEAVHGTSCDSGINHPNQYFSESQKVVQSKVDPVVV
jgi:DNA primase large subunit